MLDTRRLFVLCVVARQGSFSAAAEELAYTPSAVSQQIATLERETETILVERGPRGVTLTEAGRVLVQEAEGVIAKLEAAQRELDALSGLRAGLLRVGWFATAGATLMPRAIAAFQQQYPDIELDLFQGDPDECIPMLRARELELALVYRFELEEAQGADLEQVSLIHDELHIGLPPGHPLVGNDEVDLADLQHDRWIQGVRSGATVDVLPRACRLVGYEPEVVFQTDDRIAVEGLVAAGVGVALFPSLTLPAVRSDIALRPLRARGLSRQVSVALPNGLYRSPAADVLVEILRQVCTELATAASQRLQ